MRMIDLIANKRDGLALTEEQIGWFVEAYTHDDVPDYQASALLMAVYIRGMSRQEIAWLTLAMAHSGEILSLRKILGSYAVDKHSSGGVGDKTTLVVLPLVASCGVPVAKMSGRGLGFSGGTLDKMEAIQGFDVNLSTDEFERLAQENGMVLSGQSRQLAPADGKLYALRDVTSTVTSLPLIASSIMSKKIASGADGIVLDVKMGDGAFMTNLDDAHQLARMMVEIGVDAGQDMIAVISDMNQPLGQAVGNSLEVAEAIETLNGGGPDDLRQHCLEVAAYMLRLAGQGERWFDATETHQMLQQQLENGAALNKFRAMVAAQKGDVEMVDDPAKLPQAKIVESVKAERDGYISRVAAKEIALAAFELGAGREKKEDEIDLAVGVKVRVNVGDKVHKGDELVTVYANDAALLPACYAHIEQALAYSSSPVEALPLFYDTIFGEKHT